MSPAPEMLIGAGVLFAWIALFYLGLAWFWRMGRDEAAGQSRGR